MITPIQTMTIDQICNRQDDLLVSVDDIREVAKRERNSLAVEKLEDVYDYIVGSSFDEVYIIRKLKQKNACLRIINGMKKCGQVTYTKQLQAALKEEGVDF